jgi:hypothetical protein
LDPWIHSMGVAISKSRRSRRQWLRGPAITPISNTPGFEVDLNLDPGCLLDPLIKSDPQSISTEVHDDIRLEDLYAWD